MLRSFKTKVVDIKKSLGFKTGGKGMNTIRINGNVISGNFISGNINITTCDGITYINGTEVSKEPQVNIVIEGDVKHSVSTQSGDVTVEGSIFQSVNTQSGDVIVNNDIGGNVSTMSGDVTANLIRGNPSTMSGDIRSH